MTGVERALLIAIVALLIGGTRAGVAEPLRVVGDSMAPTLHDGDVVVVDKVPRNPERDDLVVFRSPQDGLPSVKRVVGVAGDVVAIRDALLHVDGALVSEPYVDHESIDALYYGPITVPEGNVLVLGDRRSGSIDSRQYGSVPTAAVEGRVVTRLWPLTGW